RADGRAAVARIEQDGRIGGEAGFAAGPDRDELRHRQDEEGDDRDRERQEAEVEEGFERHLSASLRGKRSNLRRGETGGDCFVELRSPRNDDTITAPRRGSGR